MDIKIDHLALYVRELEVQKISSYNIPSRGFSAIPQSEDGFQVIFLSFGSGARLEIMTRPEVQEQDEALMRTGFYTSVRLASEIEKR